MAQALDTPKTATRAARLEARLPRHVHDLLKQAAKLKGRSVTDFVVAAAEDAARRAIEEDAVFRVSVEDQRRIAELLIKPPKPNAALRRAAARYRKLVAPE